MSFAIFTDLDRTLLPNGTLPESNFARQLFKELINEFCPIITYVTGRNLSLAQEAMNQYEIPVPDYLITDVGTTIYQYIDGMFLKNKVWQEQINRFWQKEKISKTRIEEGPLLQLQEPDKQTPFKVSYYVDPDYILQGREYISACLNENNCKSVIVTSIDETNKTGFLDILPCNATKLDAVRFVIAKEALQMGKVIYCGDSGNDMSVLTSEIPSVLVANATNQVRSEALQLSSKNKNSAKLLYLAKGGYAMNGNYCAGIMEGVAHFIPQVENWLLLRSECIE